MQVRSRLALIVKRESLLDGNLLRKAPDALLDSEIKHHKTNAVRNELNCDKMDCVLRAFEN